MVPGLEVLLGRGAFVYGTLREKKVVLIDQMEGWIRWASFHLSYLSAMSAQLPKISQRAGGDCPEFIRPRRDWQEPFGFLRGEQRWSMLFGEIDKGPWDFRSLPAEPTKIAVSPYVSIRFTPYLHILGVVTECQIRPKH